MTKRLFLVGAGASKDCYPSMLLGFQLLEKIKGLKIQIYFELVFLIFAKNLLLVNPQCGEVFSTVGLKKAIEDWITKTNYDKI